MPFDPPGTDIGYEPPPPDLLDARDIPWQPDPISGPTGLGDYDFDFDFSSGDGDAPGSGSGSSSLGKIGNFLKQLFGKNKDKTAMAIALLAAALSNRGGGLGDSAEMKALLAGQKRRMDEQDPLFSAATRTAFSLLPTASREGLSMPGFGAPPMTRLQQRSANVDEFGQPAYPSPRAWRAGGPPKR